MQLDVRSVLNVQRRRMLLACVSLGIKIAYCLYRVFQKSGILVQQTITPLKSINQTFIHQKFECFRNCVGCFLGLGCFVKISINS